MKRFAAGLGEDVIMAMVKGMDAFAGSSDCRSFFMSAMRGDCDGMGDASHDCAFDVMEATLGGGGGLFTEIVSVNIYLNLDKVLEKLANLCAERKKCKDKR